MDLIVLKMLTMKTRIDRAMIPAPAVDTMFHMSQPMPSGYGYVRRGWPWRPRMCIGPKARLKPMNISQKWILPSLSSSIFPVTFGNQ